MEWNKPTSALIAFVCALGSGACQSSRPAGAQARPALVADRSGGSPRPSRVYEVDGRQGVAVDFAANRMWIAGSATLSLYDLDGGRRLSSNPRALDGLVAPVNHLGAIAAEADSVWAVAEHFDGFQTARGRQLARYDRDTLKLKSAVALRGEAPQELAALTYASPEAFYVASWLPGPTAGAALYLVQRLTGQVSDARRIIPEPRWQLGLTNYGRGGLLLACDDGDAEADASDGIYLLTAGAANWKARLFFKLDRVRAKGEVEGVYYEPRTSRLFVLHNRGMAIRAGRPVGLLPGYTREIHEVYVFEVPAPE